MEIESSISEDTNGIGKLSQKKGRFIIQELEEENQKKYTPTSKKYSFDNKKIIFSYFTYENTNFPSINKMRIFILKRV